MSATLGTSSVVTQHGARPPGGGERCHRFRSGMGVEAAPGGTFLKRVGNSFTLRHPLTLGRRASTAETYLENIETTAPRLLPDSQGSIMGAMNLGFPEMMFIFLLALIIFGPKKLPEIGRQIGKALNEFRRASNEFKAQIEAEINQLDVETRTQQILPPGRSPEGAIAAGSREEATATNPEIKSKVQDA